jgi:hypothetical protein
MCTSSGHHQLEFYQQGYMRLKMTLGLLQLEAAALTYVIFALFTNFKKPHRADKVIQL